MTEDEQIRILQTIKQNAPHYYLRLRKRLRRKRQMISKCIDIASRSDEVDYQSQINGIYNTSSSQLNYTERILLNFICLIKHKEHINNGVNIEDEEIQKWLGVLQRYSTATSNKDLTEPVISLLDKQTRQIINQYRIKNGIGRPKGKGKYIFSYNGKEYHTIQECANDYNISKQGMHKRLKKLQVI